MSKFINENPDYILFTINRVYQIDNNYKKVIAEIINSLSEDKKNKEKFVETFLNSSHLFSINNMLKICFPKENVEVNTMNNMTHYIMLSRENIKTLFTSYIENLQPSLELLLNRDLQIISFFSIKTHINSEKEAVKIIEKDGTHTNTNYDIIYNVCKNKSLRIRKKVCADMINIIKQEPKYQEGYPLFLHVKTDNKNALECYENNDFQIVKDVFTDKDPLNIIINDVSQVFMCYNKKKIFIQHGENEYILMPIDVYSISLVAHGAFKISQTDIFNCNMNVSDYIESQKINISFPFKEIQYFVEKGNGLCLPNEEGNNKSRFDICYENILAVENEYPTNSELEKLNTIPMIFSGPKASEKGTVREELIGLYDCNKKIQLIDSEELFKDSFELKKLISIIRSHCDKYHIPMKKVSLKIFSCRGLLCSNQYAFDTQVFRGGQSKIISPFVPVETKNMEELLLDQYMKENNLKCNISRLKNTGDTRSRRNLKKSKRSTRSKPKSKPKSKSLKNRI